MRYLLTVIIVICTSSSLQLENCLAFMVSRANHAANTLAISQIIEMRQMFMIGGWLDS